MKIKEVIVVEGKNDSVRLKQFFDCETIETHGTCLSDFTINLIKKAQEETGVIIFTDPDAPGNMIRSSINQKVAGCKNAFIDKHVARTDKKVGIEHASKEDLEQSLSNLMTYDKETTATLTIQDFYELGLTGKNDSSKKRELLGRQLHVGDANAKTILNRCNMLKITKEEIMRIINE